MYGDCQLLTMIPTFMIQFLKLINKLIDSILSCIMDKGISNSTNKKKDLEHVYSSINYIEMKTYIIK